MAITKSELGILPDKIYKALVSQAGGANPTTINVATEVGTLVFIKDSAGYFKCDISSLGYVYTKVIPKIINNSDLADVTMSIRLRNDNVLEIKTNKNFALTDDLLDKTPVELEFYI
jgi:hypothetical protein